MTKLTISLQRNSAVRATRVAIGRDRLVYALVADKRVRYKRGYSRIVYIGTTKKGLARIARSVAIRAEKILKLHGVRAFEARVMTCRARQRVKTWLKLERALLIKFRERYGEPPKCNTHGKRMKRRDEFEYFSEKRVADILDQLS